nr:MAG TPA_asm: hypothetical protein [Caudoviricetes sp.]
MINLVNKINFLLRIKYFSTLSFSSFLTSKQTSE